MRCSGASSTSPARSRRSRATTASARERYTESLAVRERLDDRAAMASLQSNLGVVAEYEGDYDASRAHNERALELRRAIGDRWATRGLADEPRDDRLAAGPPRGGARAIRGRRSG